MKNLGDGCLQFSSCFVPMACLACILFPYILCVFYTLFVHFLRLSPMYLYLHFLLCYSAIIIAAFYFVGFAFLSTYKSSHQRAHTQPQQNPKPKKKTLSNPREKVATWLTNCSVQFRSSFPLGQEVNTAISAKQSEYKCGAVVDKAGSKGGSRQAKGNM